LSGGFVNSLHFLPVFMIGLLGGVHCVGMCGGIVGAFSVAPGQRRIPIAVSGASLAVAQTTAFNDTLRVLAYNTGRIGSYVVAGAIAGGVAQGLGTLSFINSIQLAGYWLANLMLILLGLHLMGVWHGIARVEKVGQVVWRRVQPLIKHLLPVDSPSKALALGGLWGWVPCGMVYSVLLTALLSGSAAQGAATMFAFGLGTLPLLLTMGLLGTRLRTWLARRSVRMANGAIVLAFGLLGLWRAAHGMEPAWFDVFCVTPSSHVGAR
jgi:uncharacterized protein